MKKYLLITASLLFFTCSIYSQSLQLLKKTGEPVMNDTIVAAGTLSDEEMKVPVYVKNLASVSKDVYVRLDLKQMVEGSQMQYCWNSCFDIETTQSTYYLSIAAGDTAKDFYSLYKPKGLEGVTEIRYTFFVNKDESDSASVTISYEVVSTGNNPLEEIKQSIACFPNPATDFVQFNYEINNASTNRITIYNLVGNKVEQIMLDNYSVSRQVDVSKLNPGIYIWTFESDGVPLKTDRLIIK